MPSRRSNVRGPWGVRTASKTEFPTAVAQAWTLDGSTNFLSSSHRAQDPGAADRGVIRLSGLIGALGIAPRSSLSAFRWSPLVTCLVRGPQTSEAGLVDGRAGSCGHTARQIDGWISTSTIDATALYHRTGVAAGARMDLSGIRFKKQEVVARGGWMIGR